MMIKVSGGFLDFDGSIEVEKQVKLMDDISSTDGDFSYTFELARTTHNASILGNPLPDNINKLVYQQIPAQILNESGSEVYNGYIRIEAVTTRFFSCSFFSGNNNWFSLLNFPLQDIYLDDYEVNINKDTIQASWSNTEGNFFPLIDTGILGTRQTPDLVVEDFYPFFYLHTVVSRVCSYGGIKIQGDLLNEWRYLHAIITSGASQENSIDSRSAYASLSSPQAIAEADGAEPLIFDDDINEPYFDGSENNFDNTLGRYTADIPMRIQIEASATFSSNANVYRIMVIVNGGAVSRKSAVGEENLSLTYDLFLDAGDYVEIYAEVLNTGGSANVTTATVRITPVFLYRVQNGEFLPTWTGSELLANVFNMFCCIVSYDARTKTITANLFDKIKSKQPIDLSNYIGDFVKTDYIDFISNYGKRTRLLYEDSGVTEFYNARNFVPYGAKDIAVNNDFLEDEVEAFTSGFVASKAYENEGIGASVEQFEFFELEDAERIEITSITDNSGTARINMASYPFRVGDIVRLDTDEATYNGDWIVETLGVGYIEVRGMSYVDNATGSITRMYGTLSTSDDVYILLAVPSTPTSSITDSSLTIGGDSVSSIGYAYFNMINKGRAINILTKSLSFGPINDVNHYQVDMFQDYFRTFQRMLNDPSMVVYEMYLPLAVYLSIDHQSPVTIKSIETTNQYYVNRITGYKESYLPGTVELIKLP